MRALNTAASGMMAQQLNVDTIANNLANVNTTGFKAGRAEFKDMLYQTLQKGGTPEQNGKPVNVQVGSGVMPGATVRSFTQGNMNATENPLDLFIDGDGFFTVKGPNDQVFYTRDGSFKLGASEDGTMKLVTSEGYSVLDAGDNEITINAADPSKIEIDGKGTISYDDSTGNKVILDQPLKIVRFANRAGLESKGLNLFAQTDASGEAVTESNEDNGENANGVSTVLQGFLEASNVQIVDEMVKLISAQRAYEINSKSVQAADEMLGMANNLRR